MTVYTYSQLEGLWINAGGSKASAPIAAAVAEAESSGNSDATSSNPDGGTNVGLWQLDTPGGVGAGYTVDQLKDPATNAKVAVKGSNSGASWGEWATYASGAYKAFLNGGTTPDTNVPGSSASSASSTGGSTLGNTGSCVISIPNINPVPSWVPVLGTSTGACLLSKSQARGLIGGVFLAGGAVVGMVGVLIVSAGMLSHTSAGHHAGGALEAAGAGLAFVPGLEAAGLAVGATGAAARRASSSGAPRGSLDRRVARRTQGREKAAQAREAAGQQAAPATGAAS